MLNSLDIEGIALADAIPQGANTNAPQVKVRLRVNMAGMTHWPVIQAWRPGPIADSLLQVKKGHRVRVRGALAQASGYQSAKTKRFTSFVTANDPQVVEVYDDEEAHNDDSD